MMKKNITKLFLLLLVSCIASLANAGAQCDSTNLDSYFIETKKAIDSAKKDPYDEKPCIEQSQSDLKLIKSEAKDLLKGIIEDGEIPNPAIKFLKVIFTPSQVGTSSQFCAVPSKATKTADYMLNQLYMVLNDKNCENSKEIIIKSLK